MVRFLRFWVRQLFWVPVLVASLLAPVLVFAYGVEPVQVVLLAVGFLVVTLVLAAVPYRRNRAAGRYSGPTAQVAGELPASAVTPPDRLERRRGLGIVWWTLLLGSGAAIAWWIVALAGAGGFVTDDVLPYDVVALVAALAWAAIAVLFAWLRPVAVRNARLAARHPDALVLTAYQGYTNTLATGTTLAEVTGDRPSNWWSSLPMVFTLVVDAEGIGFWRGILRPRRQYQVPWELVARIDPAYVNAGDPAAGPKLGVELTLRERIDEEFDALRYLGFRPARANLWVGSPYRSREVVESVAAAIQARHPEGPAAGGVGERG
ncbi:hypothetical protein ARHIZOSPH14_24180 [Agromyces rhizosphaerae]|uniref:Uncharacterized protein n=1 Tax=Agromyces rhizosphaerae TaxID=88374 RepID=A0A9W6CY60_9MICO|nr:hypothetical protein [Agromyces rhizosphaerae]GLI28176.1 hypothetical protein ARHIZOSPH14_24180 [Agromyces rhizosphaerae]